MNKFNWSLELKKPVIIKFKRGKVYARFKDDIWTIDLSEVGSLSFKNWGVKYLLREVDIFCKYAWFKPLKDKPTNTALNGFIGTVSESKYNPKVMGWSRMRILQ